MGGRSLLPAPAVADCFHFQKWSALCRPDFPPAHCSVFNFSIFNLKEPATGRGSALNFKTKAFYYMML